MDGYDLTLPTKLWEMMEIALGDVRKCAKDSNFEIDMGMWMYTIEEHGTTKCHVCMAGAVLAQTVEVPLDRTRTITEIAALARGSDGIDKMLDVVNEIRSGGFYSAIGVWYDADPDEDTDLDEKVHELCLLYGELHYKRDLDEFPSRKDEQVDWFADWETVIKKMKELDV